MKKSLLTLTALAALSVGALAQSKPLVETRWDHHKKPSGVVGAQSVISSFNYDRIDLGYLLDGKRDSYAGAYTPVAYIPSLGIDLGPLVAKNVASGANSNDVNLGLFATYPLINKANFTLRVGAGFKGVDLSQHLNFATGASGEVGGVFVTIKF